MNNFETLIGDLTDEEIDQLDRDISRDWGANINRAMSGRFTLYLADGLVEYPAPSETVRDVWDKAEGGMA